MNNKECSISYEHLAAFCREILIQSGMPPTDAVIVADTLVEADLRGYETHGVMRLGMYLERVKRGVMKADAKVTTLQDAGAVTVLDGDNGFGQITAFRALEAAALKAGQFGIGAAAIRNGGHVGALGILVERIAMQKKIAILLANTNPIIAPWGGRQAELGNNPIGIGIPRDKEAPLLIDMALSITARGKIILAARDNKPIPPGWAIDVNGRPTTDAAQALLGTVLPMAMHKGYALALAFEILSGVLTGASFGRDVGFLMPPDYTKPLGMGHLAIVLDVETFMPYQIFAERLEVLVERIVSSPPADEDIPIRLPGDGSDARRRKYMAEGISLSRATWEELWKLSQEHGLPFGEKIKSLNLPKRRRNSDGEIEIAYQEV